MRRIRFSVPAQVDTRPTSSPNGRRWRATPGWLLLAGSMVLVGVFLAALTLIGLAGMLRLISNPLQTEMATSSPVLLMAPDLSSLAAAPAAAAPASTELMQLLTSPLPTPLPTPVPSPVATAATAAVATPTVPAPVATAPSVVVTYRAIFQEVGDTYGIDWRLLAALAFRESRLDPTAVGRDGDMGLMQILPTTWDEFAPNTNAQEPFDARHNVEVAATYLLYLQEKLTELGHGEIYWVLVAYNWGPNNVRRLLSGGGNWDDVPERQRQYVGDILEAAFGIRFVE